MIYLDNAATSWPKPPAVADAVTRFLRDVGASPGRSGHRLANEAERVRFDCRAALAELFNVRDPLRAVFMLNATAALNFVIHGLLEPGDHVVTTGMEHNATMRPLRAAEKRGVELSIVACGPDGTLNVDQLRDRLRPTTRLCVVNHASNVCGTILPIREIGALTRARGVPLLVDAAQTAGTLPIDMAADQIDLLAFTGHKSLLGPTGTGGLALADEFDPARLPPLMQGGTGSKSEHETQPEVLPDKYEPGTPNIMGLAGLLAGLEYINEHGRAAIRTHEEELTAQLIDGLRRIAGVRVLGTLDARRQTAAVSFTLADMAPGQVAQQFDEHFGIMCRPGLHCAPRAHRTLGTLPAGTVRLAPGPFTTREDIAQVCAAVARLAAGGAHG